MQLIDARPLTPTQVQDKAHELELIAGDFLHDNNQGRAFEAWHRAMTEIAKHGMNSVTAVFRQMQSDTRGLNPWLPNISVRKFGNELTVAAEPSLLQRLLGNGRDIAAFVCPTFVSSLAYATPRIHTDGKMSAYTVVKPPR